LLDFARAPRKKMLAFTPASEQGLSLVNRVCPLLLMGSELLLHNCAEKEGVPVEEIALAAVTDANGTADVSFQYDAVGPRVARTGTGGSFVLVQMDQHMIADYPVGGAANTLTYR
jgi:hypothetical protein